MIDKMVAVVVPFFSNELSKEEQISWTQMLKVFCKRDIVLVTPEKLEISEFESLNVLIEKFPDKYFVGREGYNDLMLSPVFYRRFEAYKYILICQLDVFVFKDELDYFCDLEYDYIGAPWLKGVRSYEESGYNVCYVGNGGLSLRKTSTMISFFQSFQPNKFYWEDYFIASYASRLKISPLDKALEFAFESEITKCLEKSGRWPMGIHGWWKFDLESIREIIKSEGYVIEGIEDKRLDKKNISLSFCNLDNNNELLKERLMEYLPILSKDIVLWGAGHYGDIIGWMLKKMELEFCVFVDKSSELIGKQMFGKNIISDCAITTDMISNCTWVICSEKYQCEILEELHARGVCEKNIVNYAEILKCFGMV